MAVKLIIIIDEQDGFIRGEGLANRLATTNEAKLATEIRDFAFKQAEVIFPEMCNSTSVEHDIPLKPSPSKEG